MDHQKQMKQRVVMWTYMYIPHISTFLHTTAIRENVGMQGMYKQLSVFGYS